jgi:hypothetical protein
VLAFGAVSIGVLCSLPSICFKTDNINLIAWLYTVHRLTGVDAVSRSQVAGIPQTAHLARQLQHDDDVEPVQISSENATPGSSARPHSPTVTAFLQDGLWRIRSVQEVKYLDTLAPFLHILAAPFIGSLLGSILEAIARRSPCMHGLLMLAAPSSDGSPVVWYVCLPALT